MKDYYEDFGDCYDDSFIEEHRDQEIIETAFDGDAKAYYVWKVSHWNLIYIYLSRICIVFEFALCVKEKSENFGFLNPER